MNNDKTKEWHTSIEEQSLHENYCRLKNLPNVSQDFCSFAYDVIILISLGAMKNVFYNLETTEHNKTWTYANDTSK